MNRPTSETNPAPPIQRLRLTYGKKGDARYIGHLDLARFWERVFRRIDLPLAYSYGFNPQPKMQFASALPVGIEAENELLDVWLTERVEPDDFLLPLNALPSGFDLKSLAEVPLQLPAMQASLRSARYEVRWSSGSLDADDLKRRVWALLAADTLMRPHHKKPGQSYDLRPLIEAIEVTDADGLPVLSMTLVSSQQRNGRAAEVIAALDLDTSPHRITRLDLILDEPVLENEVPANEF
ncbi:MAG: DUF2344 domain-containing protein [Caldilineales bacterium]|nr:DUF2344 domain-containing protein [Caldilineales bacterium]